VSQCDHEASIMRRPWPTRGCCAMGGGGERRPTRSCREEDEIKNYLKLTGFENGEDSHVTRVKILSYALVYTVTNIRFPEKARKLCRS
jgi:hypothetical protein